ncbi:MAG: hypothetical protein LIO71_03690 [Ruminococcus sp.]|nr:hypothetical protein [Ruminococcus sp.]
MIDKLFDAVDNFIIRLGKSCEVFNQNSKEIITAILSISTVVGLIYYLFVKFI